MAVFSKIKDILSKSTEFDTDNYTEDYLEIDTSQAKTSKSKIVVRPFTITDFNDVKPALDCLREGYTIALINIRPLKDKDLVELKRAVNKIKKTCDAIDGDIAGFSDDWIVVTPSFAKVHRGEEISQVQEE
ncbi:MAG: cell division protein SepF [Candidatus Nanoarchaeia archaeon]|nr:cell division protein SepF [Candidatus Nanoarchaeia archaeon]